MSADRLREAARVLRERAEAASPGPWRIKTYHDGAGWTSDDLTLYARHGYLVRPGNFTGMFNAPVDAHYIATMHPGVGLALADWLDAQGRHVGSFYCDAQCEPDGCDESKAATRLADLILGGDR